MIEALAFWLLALVCIGGGVSLLIQRNSVACALSLVAALLGTAGLLATLGAFFLAAVQVIVYAGAVVVLFLFVIMLLNTGETEKRAIPKRKFLAVGILAVLAGGVFGNVLMNLSDGEKILEWSPGGFFSAKVLGELLFTGCLLPFLTVGFLILLAIVGVVALSGGKES